MLLQALAVVSIACLAVGTLAFGAVYPWAFVPLSGVLALIGTLGLAAGRKGRPPLASLVICLMMLGSAITIQLIPMPASRLAQVSPGTDQFLRLYDLSYLAAVTAGPHAESPVAEPLRPISIAPKDTRVALFLFAAFAVFALGCARLASLISARPLAWGLLWIGLIVAVVAIVQDVTIGRDIGMKVYGFWQTSPSASPFGPFINRNHYAGWMLMVLPVALGLLIDQAERLTTVVSAARVRDTLAVASSPAGGRAMLLAVACVLMGLSLSLTRSRSGVGAFTVGAIVLTWTLVRHEAGGRRRPVVAAIMAMVLGLGLLGAGLNTSLGRFAAADLTEGEQTSLESVGGREAIWRDTIAMARSSPWTGQGLNSYGTATIVFQSGVRKLHNREAHNDYLQLAAEGGLLLCSPVVAAVLVFSVLTRSRFREAPRNGTTYWLRVGAVVGLISVAAQAVFEFSLQMPANAATFALLVGIALHRSPNLRMPAKGGR